jgi:Ca2+:H+ antiporter
VRPYCWFAAAFLFLSYVIGLWFTLRTHAAVIWNVEVEEKKVHPDFHAATTGVHQGLAGSASLTRQTSGPGGDGRTSIRDSQLYKRILGQSLEQVGLEPRTVEQPRSNITSAPNGPPEQPQTPHLVPPKSSGTDIVKPDAQIPRFTEENRSLVREVAEVAATAATIAARDTIRHPRKVPVGTRVESHQRPFGHGSDAVHVEDEAHVGEGSTHVSGGHDAPNWGRMKSSMILLGATLLYAIIAEILVDTVDVVLDRVDIDEKFLGITLIALVPNTTEFLVSNGLM